MYLIRKSHITALTEQVGLWWVGGWGGWGLDELDDLCIDIGISVLITTQIKERQGT